MGEVRIPVPGTCSTDSDHSLDLAQTFLARGAQAYMANTGYGWGLVSGIAYNLPGQPEETPGH